MLGGMWSFKNTSIYWKSKNCRNCTAFFHVKHIVISSKYEMCYMLWLVVITVTSFPSFASGHWQKKQPFSSGGGLFPSSGRFHLEGTALLRMIDSNLSCPHLSTSSCCVLSGGVGVVYTCTVSGGGCRLTAVCSQLCLQPPAHPASSHHGSYAAGPHFL